MVFNRLKLNSVLAVFGFLILALGWISPTLAASHPLASDPNFQTGNLYTIEFSGCNVQSTTVLNGEYEQSVVELVNEERAGQNLPPLKRVSQLDQTARYHAADMNQDNYFNHDSYDRVNNQLQFVCGWSTRIENIYTPWSSLSENIAQGYSTPADVVAGWMGSSGHRANILGTNHWEIGVGYAAGAYWVQDFGKRQGVYPMILNGEAANTDKRDIQVYIYGAWSEVRLHTDDGPWSEWLPFQNQLDYKLPGQAGAHTVTAEMRSGSQSATASDEIVLTVGSSQPQLSPLPDHLDFLYSIPDHKLVPSQVSITPANAGDTTPLTWSITAEGSWMMVSPTQGTTPQPFVVAPASFNKNSPKTLSGKITFIVTSPDGVNGSPKQINVTLEVVDRPIREIYLPLLSNSHR